MHAFWFLHSFVMLFASSTGQKYIYTGSSDKCVYIYDIVRSQAYLCFFFFLLLLFYLFLLSGKQKKSDWVSSKRTHCDWIQVSGEIAGKLGWHRSIIRDCSWHPHHQTLVSSAWDGYVVRWEASGDDEADPSSLKSENQKKQSDPERYRHPFDL